MVASNSRAASFNKFLSWAGGSLLASGGAMTLQNGLDWEATIFITVGGFVGLWRLIRGLQWSKRHLRQTLGGYAILALLITPRAHDYYITPTIAKNLTLACHYYSKETKQPEVTVLKGNFFRHFFLGTVFPPTIEHNFLDGETYGCLVELTLGTYGTALRQFTFTVRDNPELRMQVPLEPAQRVYPTRTRWSTLELLDGRPISHSVTLYGTQPIPVFPIPRLTADGKGKYPVRWEIRGTALDIQGQPVDLEVIKGIFILQLD